MKKLFAFFYMVALFLTAITLQAQDEMGGIPYTFSAKRLSMNIPQMNLATVNHATLLEEDIAKGKNNPLRISIYQPLHYTMKNSGRLDVLNDGSKLWRVNIKSPNAYALYLHFSSFEIPDGAELFVYTPDQKFVRGKYTKKNEGEEFFVLDLPGDEIIVEYYEPVGVAFAGHFEIANLGHIYRDVLVSKGAWGTAEGNCHLNVVCPDAQQWLNQINSVVCIRTDVAGEGSYLCSGAMIANTRLDRMPYVYTAAHCYKNNATWFFYFDYQSTACNNNTGGSGYVARGCALRAIDNENINIGTNTYTKGPDFMLLEITGNLPRQVLNYLYYSGWDISTSIPSMGAAIHHPGGDLKKYSKPRQYSSWNLSNFYWQVGWLTGTANKGVTEPGSSGSPLLNAQGYIVGSLSRGSSACDNVIGADYYGKISVAWTFRNNPSEQLKYWLDPDNTGATSLAGRLYSELYPVGIKENREKTNEFEAIIYPNPANRSVKIKGDFNEEKIWCKIYSVLGRLVHEESLTVSNEFELNLDLTNGVYFIELQGKEKKTIQKLLISNVVSR